MSTNQHRTAVIGAPAEDLCLDFANTLSWRGSATPSESLATLPDLLSWLARQAQAEALAATVTAAWAERHPKRAVRLFAEAIALREAVFRCGMALASGDIVAETDFAALNQALAGASPRRGLVRDAAGFAWAVEHEAHSAAALLAPVLWSAADLLAGADRLRVRRCANDECLWLFVDRSKTGSRRWCDMAACGNRAKAQRHYRRTHVS
ncbi:MAG TPA: ABATE domain-containing protein [Acetobacteraceae bacterium]|nr:ABATE domain-containing protein [Acetobacteraceae bacterium]